MVGASGRYLGTQGNRVEFYGKLYSTKTSFQPDVSCGLFSVDAKPGQLQAPVIDNSMPGGHTGHGMTAPAPRKPPSLTGRLHLIGPRRVNAPVMSLRGGIKSKSLPRVVESKPKLVHPTVIAVGRGRGIAGGYMNGVEPVTTPSFVVPNTNRIHQLMKPSGRLIVVNVCVMYVFLNATIQSIGAT